MTNLHTDIQDDPAGSSGGLPVPRSALSVGAHPDDAEFGAGGTLARWAESGCEVTMLVLTDGSKGTWDDDLSTRDLIDFRRQEQARAAEKLGASRVIHLDHVDGELEATAALREQMCRVIREIRPQVVLGHDPWKTYVLHPDHRAAGWGLIDGVVSARDHLFFPDHGLAKHRPEAILLWQAELIDHHEDIAGTFDRKIAALLCHTSQTSTTMGDANESDAAHHLFVRRMRELAADFGRPVGLDLAEGFKLLRP